MVTFIKITNKIIYDKICELERHVIKTNGKVLLNRWIGGTALSLCLFIIGALLL